MYKRNNDIKGMCGSETTKSIVSVRRDHHKHWEEPMDRLGGRDGLPPHPDRAQSRFRLGDLLQIFIILIFAGYIVTLTNIARAQVSFDTFDANVGAEIQRQLDKPTPMPAPEPSYAPRPTPEAAINVKRPRILIKKESEKGTTLGKLYVKRAELLGTQTTIKQKLRTQRSMDGDNSQKNMKLESKLQEINNQIAAIDKTIKDVKDGK
jgi:hypothetical protein